MRPTRVLSTNIKWKFSPELTSRRNAFISQITPKKKSLPPFLKYYHSFLSPELHYNGRLTSLINNNELKLHQAYQIYNKYSNCNLIKNLTNKEKSQFLDMTKFNYSEIGALLNGNKPGAIVEIHSKTGKAEDFRNNFKLLKKVFNSKEYIVRPVVSQNSNKTEAFADIFNKNKIAKIISENKELFNTRLDLNKNSTTDDIVKKIEKEKGFINQSNKKHDLFGILLGFPVSDSIVFALSMDSCVKGLIDFDQRDKSYTYELKRNLFSNNSIYKNMPNEFKIKISEKLDKLYEKRIPLNKMLNIDCQNPYQCMIFSNSHNIEDLDRIDKALFKNYQDVISIKPPNNLISFLKNRYVKKFLVNKFSAII